MTIEVLAKSLDVDVQKAQSILFRVVDFLINYDMPDDVIDCGAYHNHGHNGINNMLESHKALLWASYEKLAGDIPYRQPRINIDLVPVDRYTGCYQPISNIR